MLPQSPVLPALLSPVMLFNGHSTTLGTGGLTLTIDYCDLKTVLHFLRVLNSLLP